MRKNKSLEAPFRTIIEIIAWDLIKNRRIYDGQTKSRPGTARSPDRSRPQSGRGTKAHNPQINPMRVSNSLTKYRAKKVSSVEEMLSASPEKVMLSQEPTVDPEVSKPPDPPTQKSKERTDTSDLKKKQEMILQDLDDTQDQMEVKCVRWLSGQDKPTYSFDPQPKDNSSVRVEELSPKAKKKEALNQKLARGKSGRKVEFNLKPCGAPLDMETAVRLRRIVFGSSRLRGFNEEWINQAFMFRDCKDERTTRLRFGLIQKKGGPCGLLAAVQGFILKHLLFGQVGNDGSEVRQTQPTKLNVSNDIRTSCLAEAIIEILWRAGSGRRAVVALLSNKQTFTPSATYKEDGISEFILTNNCHSLESLHQTIYNSIGQFEKGRGAAILLLYSAILSRGISEVISDMDDPGNTLMGAHSYCTQEMVNLLTTGVASSNTFDDKMTLDEGIVLRGVTSRSDIGLLSLFEHYGSCAVGVNLKSPRYPIWIVCSESHFSIIFGLNREIVNDSTPEQEFDLYYYDGLANQDEEMRLTVNTTGGSHSRYEVEDLIPPLELCLQTRWPKCSVDWNGTEPLL